MQCVKLTNSFLRRYNRYHIGVILERAAVCPSMERYAMELSQLPSPAAHVAVWTQKPKLWRHLRQILTCWAQGACVTLRQSHWSCLPEEWAAFSGILFLDADSVDHAQLPPLVHARQIALIVVSADRQLAVQSYRWHPVAFLSPSAGFQSVHRAMDLCFPFWRQGLQWLDLPFHRDRIRLPLCQLYCAEADGRETILYCTGGQMRASVPLGKLWEELPSPPFLRCQRGFLVHLDAVAEMSRGSLSLTCDRRAVPVSRKQLREIQDSLAQWQLQKKA